MVRKRFQTILNFNFSKKIIYQYVGGSGIYAQKGFYLVQRADNPAVVSYLFVLIIKN